MTPLASWYRRTELNTAAERMIHRAVLDADGETTAPVHPNAHTPGDAWRLRGIPVVGVHGGIGGAIPGTKPHSVEIH